MNIFNVQIPSKCSYKKLKNQNVESLIQTKDLIWISLTMTELVTLRDPSNMSQQLTTPDEQQSPELVGLLSRFNLKGYLKKLSEQHINQVYDLLNILAWSNENQKDFFEEGV